MTRVYKSKGGKEERRGRRGEERESKSTKILILFSAVHEVVETQA
jgi:hypothetical protein